MVCGRPVDKTIPWPDPWSAEVDEVIPVSKGGSATDLRNLALIHRCHNQLKSDHSLEWARNAVKGHNAQARLTSIPFRSSTW